MAVVKFQCGHCAKLMAVRVSDLGKHVRCPHCRQIVQAPPPEPAQPSPAPPAAVPEAHDPEQSTLQVSTEGGTSEPTPEIRIATPADGESIFSPPEESGDDLFGAPSGSRVELPPEAGLPDLAIEQFPRPAPDVLVVPEAPPELVIAAPPASMTQAPELSISPEATISFFGVPPPPPDFPIPPPPDLPGPPAQTAPVEPTPPVPDSPLAFTPMPESQPVEIPSLEGPGPATAAALPSAPVRRPRDRGVLGILLLMFLIPYALVMTAAVGWLLYQQRKAAPFDPLERLPDPDPSKGGPQRVKFDARLPDKLKIALQQPLEIGDIEVTPLAVERVEEGGKQMLTLKLRFRNLSKDTAFDPLPQSFVTYFGKGGGEMKPYTFLKVQEKEAYGGYVEPVTVPQRKGNADGLLRPGEQAVVKLRTRPHDSKVIQLLDRYRGEVLWRVQVRRGFVQVQGKDVSATAVIGVQIDAAAIPRPEPQDARLSPPAEFFLPFSRLRGQQPLPTISTLL